MKQDTTGKELLIIWWGFYVGMNRELLLYGGLNKLFFIMSLVTLGAYIAFYEPFGHKKYFLLIYFLSFIFLTIGKTL